MMNLYRDYETPASEKWFTVLICIGFAIAIFLMCFALIQEDAKAAEEAKTSVMQDIGTSVTIDGTTYSVKQFLPRNTFGRNATFMVNTLSGKLYVTWNANAFKGSEKTLDTGLYYQVPTCQSLGN